MITVRMESLAFFFFNQFAAIKEIPSQTEQKNGAKIKEAESWFGNILLVELIEMAAWKGVAETR